MLECLPLSPRSSREGLQQSPWRFNPLTAPWVLNLKTNGKKSKEELKELHRGCVNQKQMCLDVLEVFPTHTVSVTSCPHSLVFQPWRSSLTQSDTNLLLKLSLFALDPLLSALSLSLEFPLHRDVCDCDYQSWLHSDRRLWGSLGSSLKWATTMHPGNGSSRPAQP